MFTRQKFYVADNNKQVYYIVRSSGDERSRHAYRLSVNGDNCLISNGSSEISLQFDALILAVRGICGLEAGATPTVLMMEKLLKTANS